MEMKSNSWVKWVVNGYWLYITGFDPIDCNL